MAQTKVELQICVVPESKCNDTKNDASVAELRDEP
jgi:hypothetical protein